MSVALCFLINNRDRIGPVLPKSHDSPLFKSLYQHPGINIYAFYTSKDHKPNERVDSAFSRRAIACDPGEPLPTKHGSPSVAVAMHELLACAMENPSNETFVFLSESCCPLWNANVIHDVFATRIRRSWFSNWSQKGLEERKSKLPAAIKNANIGRSWMLTGQQCSLIRSDAELFLKKLKPLILDHIPRNRMTNSSIWAIDESVFLSILHMHRRPVVFANEGPVLANWLENEGHSPREYKYPLTEEDLFSLAATDALFFRKVQSDHPQLSDSSFCRVFLNRDMEIWDLNHNKKGSTHHLLFTMHLIRQAPRQPPISYLGHWWHVQPGG